MASTSRIGAADDGATLRCDRVVSLSSGLGSAYAAKLLVDRHGAENIVGVFTDVNGEHPDNYRFLADVQYALGIRVVKINNDGRTIWDVMCEQRFLANTRVDICSRVLKRESFLKWLNENVDPARCVISLGIDWTEVHRFDRAKPLWAKSGYTIDAPLCEPPYLARSEAQTWLNEAGIKRPALYDMGFSHANCGGGCVKAGIGQFTRLLAADRRWYVNWWEAGEERVRRFLGRDDIAILRDRRAVERLVTECPHDTEIWSEDEGEWVDTTEHDDLTCPAPEHVWRKVANTAPLTLRELRERIDGGTEPSLFDDDEGEGCGVCFLAPDEQEVTVA